MIGGVSYDPIGASKCVLDGGCRVPLACWRLNCARPVRHHWVVYRPTPWGGLDGRTGSGPSPPHAAGPSVARTHSKYEPSSCVGFALRGLRLVASRGPMLFRPCGTLPSLGTPAVRRTRAAFCGRQVPPRVRQKTTRQARLASPLGQHAAAADASRLGEYRVGLYQRR